MSRRCQMMPSVLESPDSGLDRDTCSSGGMTVVVVSVALVPVGEHEGRHHREAARRAVRVDHRRRVPEAGRAVAVVTGRQRVEREQVAARCGDRRAASPPGRRRRAAGSLVNQASGNRPRVWRVPACDQKSGPASVQLESVARSAKCQKTGNRMARRWSPIRAGPEQREQRRGPILRRRGGGSRGAGTTSARGCRRWRRCGRRAAAGRRSATAAWLASCTKSGTSPTAWWVSVVRSK